MYAPKGNANVDLQQMQRQWQGTKPLQACCEKYKINTSGILEAWMFVQRSV
jgi:hypothetical protein